MYFSNDISLLTIWLLAGSLLCLAYTAVFYALRVLTVIRYRRKSDTERAEKPNSDYIPVSIVIYSQADAENLEEILRSILTQDYPAAFEVIVVNEGEVTDVRDTVSMLRAKYPNLYLTYTPDGVVNLSRKKLALTLGIKAARYDVVILTTTAAIIPSPFWLRRMAHRFGNESSTEVVLGFATINNPDDDVDPAGRTRTFDFCARSIRWLAAAIAGHPFRGTEYNLAYRRSLFLKNKGFARSLNLHFGDDDIFISEIANGANTAVELSDDSIVTIRHGSNPRLFRESVVRHISTEQFIRRRPRILFPLSYILQPLAIVASIVAAIISLPNLVPSIATTIIIIAFMTLDIITWHAATKALKMRNLLLSLPWLVWTHPLRRALAHARASIVKQKKYTWN